MIRAASILVAPAIVAMVTIVATGCKGADQPDGYDKTDFGPKPRPAGYGPPPGTHSPPATKPNGG
jgi:hypothetical protein